MSNLIPQELPAPASTERLDEETERLMSDILRKHALVVTSPSLGSLEWKVAIDERRAASNALRKRIRELVEEARKEGADAMWLEWDTKGVPHD